MIHDSWNSCDLEVKASETNACCETFGKASIEKKALSSNLTEEARLKVAAKNRSLGRPNWL